MNDKRIYEKAEVEIIELAPSDIITISSPFDGEDDKVSDWAE